MVEYSGVKWEGPKTKWVMVRCAGRRILFFVGLDHDRDVVFIDEDNDFCWLNKDQIVELPDCTGFDYVPEKVEQHKPTSRTIGADGNDERETAKLSGPEFVTFHEVVREGSLGRELCYVEHPGGLWKTSQTRNLRVK